MKTLFLTTAAFAALVMIAPIGNAYAQTYQTYGDGFGNSQTYGSDGSSFQTYGDGFGNSQTYGSGGYSAQTYGDGFGNSQTYVNPGNGW